MGISEALRPRPQRPNVRHLVTPTETPTLSIATLNAGYIHGKLKLVLAQAKKEHVDTLCIQEAYASAVSIPGVLEEAAKHGYEYVLFGDLISIGHVQAHCLIIFSRIPIAKTTLPDSTYYGRHLTILVPRATLPPLVITNIYAHAGDKRSRDLLINEVVNASNATGRQFLVAGGFNCTEDEGATVFFLPTETATTWTTTSRNSLLPRAPEAGDASTMHLAASACDL
jgi:hypothetical protein